MQGSLHSRQVKIKIFNIEVRYAYLFQLRIFYYRHIERAHGLETRWYCCHECPIKYQKSYRLTKHLIETHQLQLPSGHKRFHYIRDQDGCYRLQMVRYEAVDEENISPVEEAKLPDTKYKIEIYQKPTSTELKVSFAIKKIFN